MCGIAGLLCATSSTTKAAEAVVLNMTRSLAHRGPDAEGTWAEGMVALGHRRLSVLDLSEAGTQPMQSACGRFIIVFNGEIYNHLDMRTGLEAIGANPNWRGHSDTETMLASIVHWGLRETLKRTKGMFALAIWDRSRKRLFLARDRMGEKPLYWGWAGGDLVFGSELKALRQHRDCPNTICRDALAQYMTYAYVPAPRSIHPGIYKLEPGCVLEIDGPLQSSAPTQPIRPGSSYGSVSIWKYWSLNETLETGNKSLIETEDEASKAVEATISNAVGRQMISDVPLGAFLSGGIDSSLIVALMQQQSIRPVKTFTVGFENAAFDEAPHAAAVAKHLSTDHTEIIVTNRETHDVIPDLPNYYDEPFADSSQIPTHLVCRSAREHVTVSLSGDGGDELFGGYNRYFLGPKIWNQLEKFPKPVRYGLGHMISATPFSVWDWLGSKAGGKLAVSHAGDKAQKVARVLRDVDNIDELYRSLISFWPGSDLVNGNPNSNSNVLDDILPEFLALDPAARMMALDLCSYLPDDILCKVDRAAMSVSLETRVPFLDLDVITVSARLPTNMKIRGGKGKWVLRQVLDKHVPRKLIERPKTGFSIPLGSWLRGPLRAWADELLSPKALGVDDLIDQASVIEVWKEHLSGKRDWSQKLWIILMFQAWRAAQK
jgi:asparagine synthase (glutamine-hydrolysing)